MLRRLARLAAALATVLALGALLQAGSAAAVAPTVNGISPSSGPISGGTSVTVDGSDLTGATAVKFGASAGSDVTVSPDGTSLTVLSPPGSVGEVDVTVMTPDGTSTTSGLDFFTYLGPATIANSFSPSTVGQNGTSTLTFTLGNPNAGTSLTGASFTDSLPSGLTVAAPSNAVNDCGGTVTATSGSSSISLSGATIPSAGCTLSVTVVASVVGTSSTRPEG